MSKRTLGQRWLEGWVHPWVTTWLTHGCGSLPLVVYGRRSKQLEVYIHSVWPFETNSEPLDGNMPIGTPLGDLCKVALGRTLGNRWALIELTNVKPKGAA